MQAWLLYQQKMFDLTGIFPGGIRDMSAASYTNQVWKSTLEDMFYYGGEMQFSGKGVEGE